MRGCEFRGSERVPGMAILRGAILIRARGHAASIAASFVAVAKVLTHRVHQLDRDRTFCPGDHLDVDFDRMLTIADLGLHRPVAHRTARDGSGALASGESSGVRAKMVVMIDWPNLIAGAVLGFLLALIPWMIDRRRARRHRRIDTATAWMGAAKEIELAAQPGATSADLYLVRVRYPVDLWRSILGPNDFRALERLENAFTQVEVFGRMAQENGTPESAQRLQVALVERRDAYVEFANLSRRMQSASYHNGVCAEDRRLMRHDYLIHPVRTWKRERHNRKVRRLAPPV